jgi:hypothetical protein
MRLKAEKIDSLAHKVANALKNHKRAELIVAQVQVEGAVRRIITDDLKREMALEKEAEEILRQHKMAIDRQNMSYNTLLEKTKKELARQRKITL